MKPKPRKNARTYDSDNVIGKGTILSTRVSHAMKDRIEAAAKVLGEKKTSEVVNIALVRFLNHLPEIVKAYGKTGVINMSLATFNAFRATKLAPEEIEYTRKWVPEKVERLGTQRRKMEKTIEELQARLVEVERLLKIKRLEPVKEDQPMQVEVDLI